MKVKLELELEELAGQLNAHERVMLAKKFARWARQLFVSAQILRRDAQPNPLPTLPKCPPTKAALN
jgi:hypothetical protein